MKNIFIILYICIALGSMSYSNTKESKNEDIEMVSISEDTTSTFSEWIDKQEDSIKFLLIPFDMKHDISVLNYFNIEYKNFKMKRESFGKELKKENLVNLYINVCKNISKIKLNTLLQLVTRMGHENNILLALEKDFSEHQFSGKEKKYLLDKMEKLLLLDKSSLYKVIEEENKFYAKNFKKYLSLMIKNTNISKDLIYKKFFIYLTKGEMLAFQGIGLNDFKPFSQFVEKKLHVSEEEVRHTMKINKLEKNSVFLNLWTRSQVWVRYYKKEDIYASLLYKIKKQKNIFEKFK